MIDLSLEEEERWLDEARLFLDEDDLCRQADLKIQWTQTPHGRLPLLVVAFHLPETFHQPALAVSLVSVRRGTLLELETTSVPLHGERLKSHLLRSIEDYLNRSGVRLPDHWRLDHAHV